jgi:hypothetical protein
MHLSKLIEIVREKWIWNEERYPGLPADTRNGSLGLDGDPRSRFQRKHVLMHMATQVGNLTAIEQACDHDPRNGTRPRELGRREEVAKLLIDALQFAAIEGYTEAEIVQEIRKVLADRNRPPELVNDDVG